MNKPAICLNNVSKKYKLYQFPKDRIKEAFHPFGKKYHTDFYALKNLSLEIQKGETIGILGKNGSGKSTLLKIISGVVIPSQGEVQVQGRISSLLELGSGFNPDLSGRENIFFYGTIHGYSKIEMAEKFSEIIDFADIGDFIEQPVRMYSSGMFVRLAFSCSIFVDPDILIIDEALSVGDAKFQSKCFSRIQKFINSGKTVLFVTHSLEQIVTHCDRAYCLSEGEIVSVGSPKDVVNFYLNQVFGVKEIEKIEETNFEKKDKVNELINFESHRLYNKNEYRWGDQKIVISGIRVLNIKKSKETTIFEHGDEIEINLILKAHFNVRNLILGFAAKTIDGITVYNTNTDINGKLALELAEGEIKQIAIRFSCNMFSGDYFLSFGVSSKSNEGEVIPHDRRYDSLHMKIDPITHFFGIADLDAKFIGIEN